MKKTIRRLLCGAFFMASPLVAFAAGDIAAGEWKAQTCLGCHGVPGYTNVYPTYHVPRLAGQHADYIVAALQAYRNGQRTHKTMSAQAHRISEEDILDLAAYFASLNSAPANPQVVIPQKLQQLTTTCVACHGSDGNGSIPMYPKLAGQIEDYLYHSLLTYKQGSRKNPIMAGIVATLKEPDMKALARYFSSNPGLGSIDVGIDKDTARELQ